MMSCETVIAKIELDENSRTPKYKQIVDSIVQNIANGELRMGQKIPSINMLSEEYYLSRDTVEKAYRVLKDRKIIAAIRGKGFYITKTQLISKVNILFLINKLSSYKMMIFNSFLKGIGGNSHTDLHVYHCDQSLFLDLMEKYFGAYDYYVIMPHFKTDKLKHIDITDEVCRAINSVPKDRLIILDNNRIDISGDYAEVYQDFCNDIYGALKEGIGKIQKYRKLYLVYPEKSVYPYPKGIRNGFVKFCTEFTIDYGILEGVFGNMVLQEGDLYVVIEESDLVNLVRQIRDGGHQMGKDIGVISYNDTELKGLLGITVISTDFQNMGQVAADMVLNGGRSKVKNPFRFINRNSI